MLILILIPITIDVFILTDRHYPIIWSLLLIPHFIITVHFPSWKIIIPVAFSFSILKYIILFASEEKIIEDEIPLIILGTLVNWSVFFTVAYFRMKYHYALEEVKKLTVVDPLTGLYNRRYFDFYMEKTIPYCQITGTPLALILLDLDNFKKVNDDYGHICGDNALKHVSEVIKKTVRESDAYIRFGGEEFAIVMPITDILNGQQLAERIRLNVEKSEFIYKNTRINLTISCGVAMYNGETVTQFIENADKSLYQAKESGRNKVVIFK